MSIIPFPHAIRLILFDWDNTLIDSWGVIHHCFNHLLKSYGLEPRSLQETKAKARESLRDSFPKIFGDDWQQARDIYYKEFERRHIQDIKPLEGAEKLIKALNQAGYKIGIVSNKTHKYLLKEVTAMGWENEFSVMIGATKASHDKPHPAPAHLALSLISDQFKHPLENHHILYVGDTDIDILFAANCGFHAVLIGDVKEAQNLSTNLAPLSLNHFDTILNFHQQFLDRPDG